MAFTKVNPGGWAVNAKLSAAQINTLDTDHANALDKTTAGDTLAGLVQFGGNAQIYANTTGGAGNLNTGAISAAVTGAIQSNASQGIQSNVASGIAPTVASGITASVAGGIDGNATSGIRASVVSGITTNIAGGISAGVVGGISSGVAGGINLAGGANDYPTFPARTRTIVQPCDVCAGVSVTSGGALTPALNGVTSPFSPAAGVFYFIESGTMRANSIVNTNGVGGSSYYFPLRSLHHGATLGSAVLSFTPSAHASLPSYQQPSFGIYRTPAAYGGGPVGLLSTSFVTLAAATVGAYNAPQTLTFTPNQNFVIDTTQYIYFAIVWDEAGASGALTGNRFASIAMNYTGIIDMRFQ